MIWKVENKVTHKVDIWYSKDTIDKVVKICKEFDFLQACNSIVQIIEDAENET